MIKERNPHYALVLLIIGVLLFDLSQITTFDVNQLNIIAVLFGTTLIGLAYRLIKND
jgi:hypothetical protein